MGQRRYTVDVWKRNALSSNEAGSDEGLSALGLVGAQLSASTSPVVNPAPLVQELLNDESLTDSIERKRQRATELKRVATSLDRQRT